MNRKSLTTKKTDEPMKSERNPSPHAGSSAVRLISL